MRKVVDFDKIKDVSIQIKNKCDLLDSECEKIKNVLASISSVDKTNNIVLLLERYNNEINELRKFINVLDYYSNYMEKVSDYYGNVFNDYKKKLDNNLMEMGDLHGKN